MSLKGRIQDIYYVISSDIEHGECFYDEDMFNSYLRVIDKLRELSIQYYQENQQERKNDE